MRAPREVLLDVVFNHTAEGTWGENFWHSWKSIAKPNYYLLSKGHDTNYTGCGNTMNANDPLCAEWIHSCLKYWALEMQVDGFRFDLASALCRGGDGKICGEPEVVPGFSGPSPADRTRRDPPSRELALGTLTF